MSAEDLERAGQMTFLREVCRLYQVAKECAEALCPHCAAHIIFIPEAESMPGLWHNDGGVPRHCRSEAVVLKFELRWMIEQNVPDLHLLPLQWMQEALKICKRVADRPWASNWTDNTRNNYRTGYGDGAGDVAREIKRSFGEENSHA